MPRHAMPRTPDDILDEMLILQALAGERASLERLIGRWHGRLIRHAWHLTGTDDGAGEVVQEAWLAIVRGLYRLHDPARFKAWAFSIVTHKAADWVNRRSRDRHAKEMLRNREPADRQTDSGGDRTEWEERLTRLRNAVRELSTEHRTVLNLHYTEAMSIEQIARTLGVPNGTVKSRLHHARLQLKQILERKNHEQLQR